ncbi:hypothetical protein GGR57DRAFT_505474 [Xylariaceae sp. FL1272]|nr:hypothetical protein GGR57DRAFT_505474 [Xylariaceae sp. FL1272]
MSTTTSFPQFGRLPAELRFNIWGFACRSGSMRLKLEEVDVEYPPTFEIPPEWCSHVFDHQKQRMAILHVNTEARSEAFRHLGFLTGPCIVTDPNRGADSLKQTRIVMDWVNDIVQPAFYTDRHQIRLQNMGTFAHLTRLAITPYDYSFHDFNPEAPYKDFFKQFHKPDMWAKVILQEFPRLTHITLVFPGKYRDGFRLLSVPSPQMQSPETIDKLVAKILPGKTLDEDEKELYREKSHYWAHLGSTLYDMRVMEVHNIRKAIMDLRPEVELDVVINLTHFKNTLTWY